MMPGLGSTVLVRGPIALGGQAENVAIVTRVHGEHIDATVMPPGLPPLPVERVYPRGHHFATAYSWRRLHEEPA